MNDEHGTADHVEAPSGAAAIFGPFFNAIVAPKDAFSAIDAKPMLAMWIVLWIAVFSTAMAVYNQPITQRIMIESQRAALRAQGNEMSAEQAQQMQDGMATFAAALTYGNSIFILLAIAISAGLIWVLSAIMGGRGATFGRAFGVASVAAVIHPFIYSIYATIILNMNPPVIRRPEDASTITPTLGLDLVLAGPDTAPWLEVLLMRFDLFMFWWLALVAMGATSVLRLSKGQGIAVAVVLWIFYSLLAVGGVLLQALAAG